MHDSDDRIDLNSQPIVAIGSPTRGRRAPVSAGERGAAKGIVGSTAGHAYWVATAAVLAGSFSLAHAGLTFVLGPRAG